MKTRILIAVAMLSAVAAGEMLYVSPAGDDANPGSEARPLRTLERARELLRTDRTAPRTVCLRGGVYRLERTFTLGPEDSGSAYQSYPGERAVLSGGVAVTGWRKAEGSLWKAPSPIDDFRQLYVNGKRAVRARGEAPKGARVQGAAGVFIPDARLLAWKNARDLELIFDIQWERNILKVTKVQAAPGGVLLSMLEPAFTLARMKEGKQVEAPTALENALELLDEPGEFYLDRAAREVSYWPREGEDPATAEVIAPKLEEIVAVRGAHDIRFEGLTFAYGSWLLPSRIGHVDVQANFTMPTSNLMLRPEPSEAAYGPGRALLSPLMTDCVHSPANVVVEGSAAVTFERCRFEHLGAAGLDIRRGARDNVVSGSRFEDIAGSAIQVGDVDDHHPKDARAVVRNNRISNCYITGAAHYYLAGVGIFAGYTDSTRIEHNEITALPYTGISVGWGWGETDQGGGGYYQPFNYDTPTVSRNNHIDYNHVHGVMQKMWDGGGIYTLGIMPGSTIRGNHVHDNAGWPGGVYLDEGSGGIEVTGNLVYNVKTRGVHPARPLNLNNKRQHRDATCKIHDNQFYEQKPGSGFPQSIADKAGLEAGYRDIR